MATYSRQAILHHALGAMLLIVASVAQGAETFGPAINPGNLAMNPNAPAPNPDCNCCCTPAGAEFCACKPDICCPPPKPLWYVRAEAVILRRDVRGSENVAALEPSQSNVLLSTRELDEPFKAGPRLAIGHSFQDIPYQVEFSYFTLTDWDAEAGRRVPTPVLRSPFTGFGSPAPVAPFDLNNEVNIRERSSFRNGEFNIRRQLPMPPGCFSASFIFGVRHIGIEEEFTYHSEATELLFREFNTRTRTWNTLWGPQIGGLFQVYQHPNWWVNFEVKGAVCNNDASQYTQSSGTGVDAVELVRTQSGTAFVGDFDLNVICKLTPFFTTRIGYQAIWVDGLALASRNFAPSASAILAGSPANIDRKGTVLYHGPYAGVEFTW